MHLKRNAGPNNVREIALCVFMCVGVLAGLLALCQTLREVAIGRHLHDDLPLVSSVKAAESKL